MKIDVDKLVGSTVVGRRPMRLQPPMVDPARHTPIKGAGEWHASNVGVELCCEDSRRAAVAWAAKEAGPTGHISFFAQVASGTTDEDVPLVPTYQQLEQAFDVIGLARTQLSDLQQDVRAESHVVYGDRRHTMLAISPAYDLIIACGAPSCPERDTLALLMRRRSTPVLIAGRGRSSQAGDGSPVAVVLSDLGAMEVLLSAAFRRARRDSTSVVVLRVWNPPVCADTELAETAEQEFLASSMRQFSQLFPEVPVAIEVLSSGMQSVAGHLDRAGLVVALASALSRPEEAPWRASAILVLPDSSVNRRRRPR